MIDIKNMNHQPTMSEISQWVGNPLFDEFYQYIMEKYKAICKIEYSKDVWLRGWNIKFRKAGKGLCVLYPKETYFTILVVIGNKEKEVVETLLPQLSKIVQNIYQETKEGMGQKWLMFDIDCSNQAYQDVLKLIEIRRQCK